MILVVNKWCKKGLPTANYFALRQLIPKVANISNFCSFKALKLKQIKAISCIDWGSSVFIIKLCHPKKNLTYFLIYHFVLWFVDYLELVFVFLSALSLCLCNGKVLSTVLALITLLYLSENKTKGVKSNSWQRLLRGVFSYIHSSFSPISNPAWPIA